MLVVGISFNFYSATCKVGRSVSGQVVSVKDRSETCKIDLFVARKASINACLISLYAGLGSIYHKSVLNTDY